MHAPKVKLAVSMAPALVRKVKALVASGDASSVSAYVEHAVAAQLAAEASFDVSIERALTATGGPPTAAERARARKTLRRSAA